MQLADLGGKSNSYAWLGAAETPNVPDLLCAMQLLVLARLTPTSGARVVGFKEIRWDFNKDLDDLELLFQVFPKGRAIFNTAMIPDSRLHPGRVSTSTTNNHQSRKKLLPWKKATRP